jgi:streptogramin lyase
MLHTLTRRALVAAAAVSFAAGCSGNSLTSGPSSSLTPSANHYAGPVRILRGPDVSGPIVVPLYPTKHSAPAGWPKKKQAATLFVADCADGVLLYNPNDANSGPEGSITSGISCAFGAAVDKKGDLYVADISASAVYVFPPGATSPSLTITDGISGPYGVIVDSKGNVFVTNLDNNTVTAYAAGQTSPFEDISFDDYGQAVGIAVDSKNNVWVACDDVNAVYEIKAGSTGATNAGLSGLDGPVGITIGEKDQIFVANFGGSNVGVYKYGSTSPSETITSGIETNGPTQDGVTKSGMFFQSNQADNVVGYEKGQTTPFSTLTGASSPAEIASSPEVKR